MRVSFTENSGIHKGAKEQDKYTEYLFMLCVCRDVAEADRGQRGHDEVECGNVKFGLEFCLIFCY